MSVLLHIRSFLPSEQTLTKIGVTAVKGAFLYQLFDQAIANLLALETHRHGTSIASYPQIFLLGGKISRGGIGGQSAHLMQELNKNPYKDRSEGRIWMWEDSLSMFREKRSLSYKLYEYYWQTFEGPIRYSLFANKALFNNFESGHYLSMITPFVKYRFTPQDVSGDLGRNRVAEHPCRYAVRDISPTHLGITGSLIQGVNTGLFGRIRAKPEKFLVGLLELVSALALTYLFFDLKTPSPLCNRALTITRDLYHTNTPFKYVSSAFFVFLHTLTP